MQTAYISIGNSDDKLTQQKWATFARAVDSVIRHYAAAVHGAWYSEPSSQWQNACWCIEIPYTNAAELKDELRVIAASFSQDTIAWADALTELLAAKATQ